MPAVSYDQAVQNLNTGGLQGAELAQAQDVLKGAYAVPSQTNGPTVLTNTGIIEDKIPKLTSRLADLVPPQQTQSTPEEQATDPITAFYQNQDDSGDAFSAENDLIGGLQESSDLSTNAYINAIKSTFQADKQLLEQSQRSNQASTKNALLRSGASRYAPTVAHSLLSAENRADLQTLGKLQSDENLQIAQAMQAKQQNDYRVLEKRLNSIDSLRKQKQDIAKTVYDTLTKRKEQNSKDINSVLTSLAKNGAPPDVIAAVQDSGSLAEAIANAGDYLQEASGIAGEYLYYKRQAIAAGQIPVDFSTYQTIDANRKKATGDTLDVPQNYHDEFAATIKLASNIPGLSNAQRAETENDLKTFIANGDYPSAYAQILSSTAAKLKGAAATNFQNQQQSLTAVDDMAESLQALHDAGYDTNKLTGGADKIGTELGLLATDPRYAAAATAAYTAFQQYRQNMTGAAFGAKESAEYASVLPSPSNTFELNLAKIQGAKQYLNGQIEGAIKNNIGQGGVEIKKYAEGAQNSTAKSLLQDEGQSKNLLQTYRNTHPDEVEVMNNNIKIIESTLGRPATSAEILEAFPEYGNSPVSIVIPKGTLAAANNNPGNLRFVGQAGAVPGKSGFAAFKSPQEGFNALVNQIKLDASRGLALADFIKKYAPPSENDTQLYLKQIATALGASPTSPLKALDVQKLAKAIARKESSTIIT